MRSAALRIPPHGGTASAPEVHHKRGRPAAARDWKEKRPARRPERWGECPHGQEVGRAGRSSLSARSARPTSCPHRCPQTSTSQLKKRVGKKSNRVIKLCMRGTPARTLAPQGRIALPRDRSGRRIPSRLSSATRKESAHALPGGLTAKEKTRGASHQRLGTLSCGLQAGYGRGVEITGFSDTSVVSGLLSHDRATGDLNKLALGDLLFIKGLTELLFGLAKRHHVVPSCFTAAVRVHPKREASCWTILTGCKPRVTAQPATEGDLGYSLA